MKKIEAIIRVSKFEEVKAALKEVGIDFLSYWDATGLGNEHHKGERVYRGTVLDTEYISRRILNIVVRDVNLKKTIDCILKYGRTGEIGDGKIFVWDIQESYRIRTGESGDVSLFNLD
jgi:nitrogen regulatory protein P-II 1